MIESKERGTVIAPGKALLCAIIAHDGHNWMLRAHRAAEVVAAFNEVRARVFVAIPASRAHVVWSGYIAITGVRKSRSLLFHVSKELSLPYSIHIALTVGGSLEFMCNTKQYSRTLNHGGDGRIDVVLRYSSRGELCNVEFYLT